MDNEHHSDVRRADGRVSEARYGPGSAAAARRREQLATQAATRVAPRTKKAAKPRAPARPILSALRRRWIVGALSLATVAALAAVLLNSPLTRIRRVRVSGVSALLPDEAAQTAAAATVPSCSNLIRIRASVIESNLRSLPWVASASIHRQFPGTLQVVVKPRVPKACLAVGGQSWEVDGAGVPIRPLRAGMSLPLVESAAGQDLRPGIPSDAAGLPAALKVIAECHPPGQVRIAKVDIDANGELCLNMSDNVAIRLGRDEALPTKIDYVQRIYDDKPSIGSEVQSIDLRWPESPSCVLRKQASSGPNEATQPSPLPTGGPSFAPGRD